MDFLPKFDFGTIIEGARGFLDAMPWRNKRALSPIPDEETPYQTMKNLAMSPSPTPIPSPTPAPMRQYGRHKDIGKYTISPEVRSAILDAATHYDVNPDLMFDIARQESSFNPKSNPWEETGDEQFRSAGYPKGLFQITDPTMETLRNYKRTPGNTLIDFTDDLYDPRNNAMLAAYLISKGQLGRWDASLQHWGDLYSEDELRPYYVQSPGHRDVAERNTQ